ncbi:MAG: glycoside hydrolase family 15 protein [Firmicutes bacterium]|nr:glycoside hydrolase family 15 protein [Bacillota bacterium]
MAVVWDGQTAALLNEWGDIVWWCVPRFDAFPFFAQALDPHHGGAAGLRFEPAVEPVFQHYLSHSAVVETGLQGNGIEVVLRTFMVWGSRLLLVEATVTNRASLSSPQIRPFLSPIRTKAYPLSVFTGVEALTLSAAHGCIVREQLDELPRLSIGEQAQVRFVFAYGQDEFDARAVLGEAAIAEPLQEAAQWEAWLSQAFSPNLSDADLSEGYERSLMTMRLLADRESGGMLAAVTASFPATPAGDENWDYRFVWLRDGALMADALDRVGIHEESSRFYDFVFARQEQDGSWTSPLYPLSDEMPPESVINDLSGPHGEQPIRFGNAAAQQLQLDSTGVILHGYWEHVQRSGRWEQARQRWPAIFRAAQWTAKHWALPENGIWEVRERRDHWLWGKAACFGAMSAAARFAAHFGDRETFTAFRETAEQIRAFIVERFTSPAEGVYLGVATEDGALDISAFGLLYFDVLSEEDTILQQTIAAWEQPMARVRKAGEGLGQTYFGMRLQQGNGRGGLQIHGGTARYEQAALPFYLATFWLAEAEARIGKKEEAYQRLKKAVQTASPFYLFGEHYDPLTGTMWGNLPQGFAHAGFVDAVLALVQGERASACRQKEDSIQ